MTVAEYARCIDAPGYRSEIIDGVVYVSPSPLPQHSYWQRLVQRTLERYCDKHSDRLNHVATDVDVVIRHRGKPTRVRPDVAAFCAFPSLAQIVKANDWALYQPLVVAEIISAARAAKDIERNRALYWLAGGIAEYWIIDPRRNALQPALVALVREPGKADWTQHRIAFGKPWRSVALPGLVLNLKHPTKAN
ncbi:MAG: Uma2 family endonuclease [Phycisphaerae bacterium]